MSLAPYQPSAPQNADGYITRNYLIYDGMLGRDQAKPINFSLPEFKDVDFASINVTLGATRQDIPLLGWKLENIKVNGVQFVANDPINSEIVIHNITKDLRTLYLDQPNQLLITHTPPLGAGIFTGDIPITVHLFVAGHPAGLADTIQHTPANVLSNLKNVQNVLLDFAKQNTILAVVVLGLFVALILGLGYILSQTVSERKIATQAVEGASQLV